MTFSFGYLLNMLKYRQHSPKFQKVSLVRLKFIRLWGFIIKWMLLDINWFCSLINNYLIDNLLLEISVFSKKKQFSIVITSELKYSVKFFKALVFFIILNKCKNSKLIKISTCCRVEWCFVVTIFDSWEIRRGRNWKKIVAWKPHISTWICCL